MCSHNSLGPFSAVFSTCHSKFKGSSDESGGGPQGVFGVEVWNVLFLPCYPIPTWTPSCDAKHYKADNGHLQSSNDGCDQNVTQFSRTRYHVHHIIVLPITLRPNEARMTTAGGGREVARILALSMDTVVLVTLRTRDVKTPRYIAHLVSLLLTMSEVFDLNFLLLLTRHLFHLAGVVIGTAV